MHLTRPLSLLLPSRLRLLVPLLLSSAQRSTLGQKTPVTAPGIEFKAPACSASSSSSIMGGDAGRGSYSYPYPRPSLTVDAVIVAAPRDGEPQLLLIQVRAITPQTCLSTSIRQALACFGCRVARHSTCCATCHDGSRSALCSRRGRPRARPTRRRPATQRKHDPFAGRWALPGGFVDEGEPLEQAAARELQEETSVDPSSVLLTQVGAFGDPGRDPRGWCVTVAYGAIVPSTELGVKAADDAQAAQWFPIPSLPRLAFDHKLVVRTAFRHLAAQAEVPAGLAEQLSAAADALEGPWQE
ncbi:hypothetical protein ABPG77_007679 [Micractinium sp. CCAP 211/92]